jgi:YHS domain-containing protein
MLALLLFVIPIAAQNSRGVPYPEFKEYKKWGYHLGFMIYDATKNVNPTGPYTLDHEAQNGFSIGFTKLLRAEHKISYKIGVYYQSTPVYKTVFLAQPNDTFFQPPLESQFRVSRFNFHVPLLMQFKMQLDHNIYFNLETGLMLALIQPGSADSTKTSFVTSLDDKRPFLELRQKTLLIYGYFPILSSLLVSIL